MGREINPPQIEFPVGFSPKDIKLLYHPFSAKVIFTEALTSLGFPLEIKKTKAGEQGPIHFEVVSPDKPAAKKATSVYRYYIRTDFYSFLTNIDQGRVYEFRTPLTGKPPFSKIKAVVFSKILNDFPPALLARGVVTAFERAVEIGRNTPHVFPSLYDDYRDLDYDKDVYDKLRKRGIAPFTPQELCAMTTENLKTILTSRPALAATSAQEQE